MKPFPVIVALFIGVPLIEIYLFIQLGGLIGALPTIALIITTAIAGAALLRSQGLATLQRFQASIAQGELPAFTMMEGVLLLFGGALLLTPGFFTDALGLLCLIPLTRRLLVQAIMPHLNVSVQGQSSAGHQPGGGRVLEGEYTRSPDSD